jgi:GT2 family glycosyltransferase
MTLARTIKDRFLSPIRYKHWIKSNEPNQRMLAEQDTQSRRFLYRPVISIVIPVYNTPPEILNAAIQSIFEQTYDNWQLCIANGSPKSEKICNILNAYQKKDRRITVLHLKENLGIAGNTNAAIELASGEFVGFLDHDDCLAAFALFEIVLALQQHIDADLLYSDEDLISSNGKKRFKPHFKPAYSLDLLRSINYITHFVVVRKNLGDQIRWLRSGYEGAQDYDLMLRIVEHAREIIHIPKVLYHWRHWPSSTTNTDDTSSSAKKSANDAGKKALQEHLERCGLKSIVEDGPDLTLYQVRYSIIQNPLVSIIILTRDHAEDLRKCILSIQSKSTYYNYEIVLIENASQEEKTFLLYEELQKNTAVRIITYKEPFNFSRANNYAASQALGDVFLFLNNDIEVVSPDWLERLLEHALRKEVAIVGAKLVYPNNTIQHAGVILGIGGFAGHSHKYFPRNAKGYINRLRLIQNYSAVTGACMMIRRDVFYELGGFDEQYAIAANDIDLCLKALSNNYLIVWTPYSELYHHESKTRGNEDTEEKKSRYNQETTRFRQKWSVILDRGDDYYSPNLSLSSEDFSINPDPVNMAIRIKSGLANSKPNE